MKKTLVSFTISFACFIGFCTFANADFVQSWDITTADVNAWKVAKLLQAKENEVAGKRANITEAVLYNYLNGYSTVANQNKTLAKGASLIYGDVKRAYWDNTICATDAITSSWGFYPGVQPNPNYEGPAGTMNNIGSPGYYAFRTEFSVSSALSDLTGLFLNLDLTKVGADDGLAGIYLNGFEIAKFPELVDGILVNAEGTNVIGSAIPGFNGSVLLDDLIAQGVFFTDEVNRLEFVIYNQSSINNPYHFKALGEINIGDQQYDHSFAPTPEPATLLICLTCGGLALAIRRRKNKKTE